MLSLAMIRVEPGSTPGIGITITEQFFFVFCVMFFCFFARENWSHVILAAAVLEIFSIYLTTDTWFWGLHTTTSSSTKSMNTGHGYTGGTYLIFPPFWPPLPTSYNRND